MDKSGNTPVSQNESKNRKKKNNKKKIKNRIIRQRKHWRMRKQKKPIPLKRKRN